MKKNWNELWKDEDKIRRWRIPDKHVEAYLVSRADWAGKALLDIGSGLGRHTIRCAKLGMVVQALEPADSGVEYLTEWLETDRVDGVSVKQGGLTELDQYPASSCDLIVCWNVLYHARLAEMLAGLREIRRIAKPGAEILLTLNSRRNKHFGHGVEVEPYSYLNPEKSDGDHIHHYSDLDEVRKLCADFEIVSVNEDEEDVGGKSFKDAWHWYILLRRPG